MNINISNLSEQGLVPPSLFETYQAPVFPAAGVPTEEEWNDSPTCIKDLWLGQ